jgi:hypothetical protein
VYLVLILQIQHLFEAHVNSLVLQTIDKKLLTQPRQFIDFSNRADLPMMKDYIEDLLIQFNVIKFYSKKYQRSFWKRD